MKARTKQFYGERGKGAFLGKENSMPEKLEYQLGDEEVKHLLQTLTSLKQLPFLQSQEDGVLMQALLQEVLAGCQASSGALFLTFHSDHQANMIRAQPHRLAGIGFDETDLQMMQKHLQKSENSFPSRFLHKVLELSVPLTLAHAPSISMHSQAHVFLDWEEALPLHLLKQRASLLLEEVSGGIKDMLIHLLLISRIRALEQEVAARSDDQMELFKSELLASVSHELRSPLASIKGYAATLLLHDRRIVREERLEFLRAIEQASKRLEEVVDRLLEMSLLETGKLILHLAPVNLIHLLQEALTAREMNAREKMEAATRPDKRPMVFQMQPIDQPEEDFITLADRQRLREVFDHVLSNAVNYSPDGGTITVGINRTHATALSMASQKQDLIEICIQDEGMGVSLAHQSRIFERFYRIDTSLTREINGLGLGLTFCERILELHQGQIWVESQEGLGSTFHIALPVNISSPLDTE
jgi:signal transduction histidine kinase